MKKRNVLCLILVCIVYFCNLRVNSATESNFNQISSQSSLFLDYSISYKYEEMGLFPNPDEEMIVTTPNGSAVKVYKINTDLSSSKINEYNQVGDSLFPYATRISTATRKYNCHSYAWYSSSTSNSYWMDDPSAYYKDGSYVEVTTPKSGDIICYFDDNGTPNNFSDDINIHSGIVLSYDSSISPNGVCGTSNQVVVRSKWGAYGLYEHNGDYCPYVSKYSDSSIDPAEYVKYYRRHPGHNYIDHYCVCGAYSSVHDYHAPYTWKSYTLHLASCGCGTKKEVPHVVSSDAYQNHKDRYVSCLLCGGQAEIGFVPINSITIKYVSENGSFILPNGVIVLVDEDIEDYLNGNLEFMEINDGLETE